MVPQFEWWVGDRDASERIAQTAKRKLPRGLSSALRVVLVSVVVVGVGSYIGMRLLYERAQRQALPQIQDVIDLETRALAEGHGERYMAQQDRAAGDWYRLQATCANHTGPTRRLQIAPVRQQDLCFAAAPAEIEDLELRGDIAWVKVRSIQDDPAPLRRVRFYRRTDQGWKHTAPRAEFWGDPVQSTADKIRIHYHERDQPSIDPLLDRIAETIGGVSSDLLYTLPVGRARVTFVADLSNLARSSETGPLYAQDGRLFLFSPWLSGIPVEGTWDTALLDQLTYQVAHGLALAATRSAENRPLGQLQRALAAEYAAWYTTQDLTQAPILGRIIQQHGREALARVFLSSKGAGSTTLFMIRWLSVHPQDAAFFETVLNIERDAIAIGQTETFLLFQDENWMSAQGRHFDWTQIESLYPLPDAVEVLSTTFGDRGDYVAIRLREPFLWHTNRDNVLVFHRDNWDWKVTAPDTLSQEPGHATPTPAPGQTP